MPPTCADAAPDGSQLHYVYDGAHRLTEVRDALGNRIVYTLDAMGNRTQEQVFDPNGTLSRAHQREYDALNRLFRDIGGANPASQITQYAYDANGNLTQVSDPLGRVTNHSYDALNRLIQDLQPPSTSGATRPASTYDYDSQDRLSRVTDARSLSTAYSVDGLGNRTQTASPDTGTSTVSYDEAGNIKTRTDAKGQLSQYSYDALNRLTQTHLHDGTRQSYTYDQGVNALGRLSSLAEYDSADALLSRVDLAYDAWGRVTGYTQSLAGTSGSVHYHYDAGGRLDQLTYPSGRSVEYSYNFAGQLQRIGTTAPGQGTSKTVVENIAYQPFGAVARFTYGNGQQFNRGFDLDGRIALYSLGAGNYALGYDAASQLRLVSDVTDPNWLSQYDYDGLGRLTHAQPPGESYAYTYDGVGNRLTRTTAGGTTNTTYSASSNRLATISGVAVQFDANGSLLSGLGAVDLGYDARGRLTQAVSASNTTAYYIDALGQRIRKSNLSTDTLYYYDLGGHLIAEGTLGGAPIKEYLYLGDLPVGVVAY